MVNILYSVNLISDPSFEAETSVRWRLLYANNPFFQYMVEVYHDLMEKLLTLLEHS